jgi:hypothetical protein
MIPRSALRSSTVPNTITYARNCTGSASARARSSNHMSRQVTRSSSGVADNVFKVPAVVIRAPGMRRQHRQTCRIDGLDRRPQPLLHVGRQPRHIVKIAQRLERDRRVEAAPVNDGPAASTHGDRCRGPARGRRDSPSLARAAARTAAFVPEMSISEVRCTLDPSAISRGAATPSPSASRSASPETIRSAWRIDRGPGRPRARKVSLRMSSGNDSVVGQRPASTRYVGKYRRNNPFPEAVCNQDNLAMGQA